MKITKRGPYNKRNLPLIATKEEFTKRLGEDIYFSRLGPFSAWLTYPTHLQFGNTYFLFLRMKISAMERKKKSVLKSIETTARFGRRSEVNQGSFIGTPYAIGPITHTLDFAAHSSLVELIESSPDLKSFLIDGYCEDFMYKSYYITIDEAWPTIVEQWEKAKTHTAVLGVLKICNDSI